jgi:putative peptidoglycan lipid II flippase
VLVDFVRVMTGNLGATMLVVVGVGVLLSPALVLVFAPGFWRDPERFALTRDLVQITFPYLGFISMTAFAGSVLNSHHRYAVPAFTPVLLNLTLIAAMLFAAAWFEQPVFALAWGVLAAGLIQLLFQLPALGSLGLVTRPRVSFRHSGAKRVGTLLLPAVFAASVGQINALIDTMLASTLITGSISWLYYSDRLLELPIGLVAVALGTVLLPNLSRLDNEADLAGFRETLDWGIRVGVFFGLPAAVALYVLSVPLISTIFLHGALTTLDARMAALSLEAFAVGLLPLVLVKVLAPGYFAQEDTRTPFRIGVVAVGVNIALNLALFRIMGHVGLAFATSAAACVNAYLLWRGLHHAGRCRPSGVTGWMAWRCTLGCGMMVLALWWLAPPPEWWLGAGIWERALWLSGVVVVGAAAYLGTVWASGGRISHLLHRA